MAGLDWAESDVRSNRAVGEADSSATWADTDSSEPVTEGRNIVSNWWLRKVSIADLDTTVTAVHDAPTHRLYGTSGLLVSCVAHSEGCELAVPQTCLSKPQER
jgi:hypothetical protein